MQILWQKDSMDRFVDRFFQSKTWKNQQIISAFLKDPKTFREICEALKRDRGIEKPESSAYYALKELIRRGQVVGEINGETLKGTKNRLDPIYRYTGRTFWIEAPEKSGYEVVCGKESRMPIYIRRMRKIKMKPGRLAQAGVHHIWKGAGPKLFIDAEKYKKWLSEKKSGPKK